MRQSVQFALGLASILAMLWAPDAPAQGRAPSSALLRQIDALREEKASRTPAQRKIGSRLLYASKIHRGVGIARVIPTLRTSVEVATDGTTLVDLRADVTTAVLDEIEALGGTVIHSSPAYRSVRARLALEGVETLAGLPEVQSIRPAARAITHKVNTSEGDIAHAADAVRTAFGVDGTGIKIGVLSDGVSSLAARQASGDLPANVTVLPGQAGSGNEGTAMLEIVYDLAPGAELLFATAFTSQASFANNILALRNAGADVIVDDVAYFAESVFQDDDVAQSVNTVTANGALYFSSAGNSGNLSDGTSGVWEGDYAFSGTNFNGEPAHDFGVGVFANAITKDAPFVFLLQWSDAKGASGNDYDLFLVDAAMTTIFDASTDIQNGNDDPLEIIGSGPYNDTGNKLIVTKSASAAGRYLHLNTIRGELALATAGQTSGHSAAQQAFSVAAVDVDAAGGPGGVFDGTESLETYSSDGPRRIFYQADGTPITPGNFSSTGGTVRQKPDITAADCVSTSTPGFAIFCGTSAAAPHAAAIAALLLDLGGSGVTPQQIRDALTTTALDIEAPGVDRDAGFGIVDAFGAAQAVDQDDCQDGIDNDGDGQVDWPGDPGCDSAGDPSERSSALPCDDGDDNDGDTWVDFDPDPGEGDPGCMEPASFKEDPECQDGINNDPHQDSFIDFDGGVSAGVANPTAPDPNCPDSWRNKESAGRCGLGFELVLLLPPLLWRAARRRNRG